MIKKLRSLRDVEIELGKFNVLVGPNASGKSNLLDSLAFLSEIAQKPIGDAFKPRGGFEHVVFGGEEKEIEFFFEFVLDEEPYFLSISICKNEIGEEKLNIGGKIVIDREEYRGRILKADGTLLGDADMSYGQSAVFSYGMRDHFPQAQKFHDYLSSWKFYQPITLEIRKTFQAKKSFNLERSGKNLIQVLLFLHTERPKVFHSVEETLKQGIPEVGELLTPLTEDGQTFVALRGKGFEQVLDYYQLSDGTLKLLSYITALALAEPNLVCFEEPENFIHARLLKLLVEILKESEKQVILSTHSPYLVDSVEPEDVIVVEKEGNETKVSRVENAKELKKRLEDLELGFGEYYYSGAIGGVP